MSRLLNIAIIGLGYWGPLLLRNFSATLGCRVSMCCDRNPRLWNGLNLKYYGINFVASAEEIFAAPEVDAVVIATPARAHYALCKRALEAGKHVLVEKPLTVSAEHAEELCELAERKGLVLQVDHVFLHSPAVRMLKKIIDSRRLGSLLFIDGIRINRGRFREDVNVLWDLAPHDLSIVDYFLGRMPHSLKAVGTSHAIARIEDVAYLTMDFGNGLVANFHLNWLSPVKVRRMMIGGSEQSVVYDDLDHSRKIKVYDEDITSAWSPRLIEAEPLARMATHFVDCIKNGVQSLSDGRAGTRIVRILEAADRSMKSDGSRISL